MIRECVLKVNSIDYDLDGYIFKSYNRLINHQLNGLIYVL